jgi:hypothetical protein
MMNLCNEQEARQEELLEKRVPAEWTAISTRKLRSTLVPIRFSTNRYIYGTQLFCSVVPRLALWTLPSQDSLSRRSVLCCKRQRTGT